MEIKNKVVVITGGSKGFGKALAEIFLREGAKVIVCSINKKEGQSVAEEIGAKFFYADVKKEEDLIKLLDNTIEQFGGIDIWINNAGMWLPHSFAEDFDMNQVKNMFDVNIIGTINGTRVALRNMKKNGKGVIVNIISDSGLKSRPKSTMYSASKWAINGFTKGIRDENKNLLILSVYPGGMKTKIFGEHKPLTFENFMDPKEVAQKVIDNIKLEKPEEELIISNNF